MRLGPVRVVSLLNKVVRMSVVLSKSGKSRQTLLAGLVGSVVFEVTR